MGLAGLGGRVHAALEATAGWDLQRAGLLCRSKEALGGDLLNILPAQQQQQKKKLRNTSQVVHGRRRHLGDRRETLGKKTQSSTYQAWREMT